jgi:ferredoxin-NADP reductase
VLTQPAASSALAFVTTVHLGMAALRSHRTPSIGPISPLALVSLALASFPWLFPSTIGLAAGVVAHVAWFVVCERYGMTPLAKPAATPGAGRPAPTTDKRPTAIAPLSRVSSRAERPTGFVQAAVLATLDETPTVRTIRLARPDGFDFEPGQFVTARMRVDGAEYARCYSISSAPQARGYLEISVKRLGLVSNALHASIRPGASMFIKAPLGAFTYPAGDDRPILLLAGGIGITPLVSMLRHAVATEPARPVTLLYCARSKDELAFRDELEATARRHPQMQLCLAVSGGGAGPECYPGHLDESLLRATVRDLQHSIALICGPAPMIDAMRATLTALGVPPPQIRSEVFQAAVAASAGAPPAPKPRRPALHHMNCLKAGRRVPVEPGQTLLEAAEAGGVAVPSLCRAGVCGTCRISVTEGDVACDSAALDADDREKGFVFACVSTAQSDCVVDL